MSDDELPRDPWELSDDESSRALEHAGALFEALVTQETVPALFRAIGALDESEAAEANRRGHEASFVRGQGVAA